MIGDVQALLDQYWIWLRDRTSLREIGDWTEITTPYLDRHNDCLQIYAKRVNGGFVLTDDGYVVDDLEQSGCKIDSTKRQALFKTTLNGFGVKINDKALEVHASADNFALRKHNLVQAMLAVNDLFYLASPVVANLFYEDGGGLARPFRYPVYAERKIHREERLRSPVRLRHTEVEGPAGAGGAGDQPAK